MVKRLIPMVAVVFLSLFPLGGNVSQARPIPALVGLEALRAGMGGITDFTAEISQEKRLALMKRTMTMTGTIRFRKPDLFMLELNPPFAGKTVLRDAVVEQAVAGSSRRNRVVLPPEQGLRRWFDRLTTPVTVLPDGLAVRADLTDGLYTLVIIPAGAGQMKEVTIVFQGDGTMQRLVLVERTGDRAVMTFKKVRRNTGLSELDFKIE